MDEILGRENYSIKRRAENMISYPDFYTLDDIKEAYTNLQHDNRLNISTRNTLLNGLKRLYRNKKRG